MKYIYGIIFSSLLFGCVQSHDNSGSINVQNIALSKESIATQKQIKEKNTFIDDEIHDNNKRESIVKKVSNFNIAIMSNTLSKKDFSEKVFQINKKLADGDSTSAHKLLQDFSLTEKKTLEYNWLLSWYYTIDEKEKDYERALDYLLKTKEYPGWDQNEYILFGFGLVYSLLSLDWSNSEYLHISKDFLNKSLEVNSNFIASKNLLESLK